MEFTFSRAASQGGGSIIREILKLTQGRDIISLAGGLPAEEFFPVDAVRAACDKVFSQGPKALQYGLTEGFLPLRETLAARITATGWPVGPDNLQLTTGSQQAIDLLCRVLLDPGDSVLVQQPTYLAALQSFRGYQVNVVAVKSDGNGMDAEHLEQCIREHAPRFVYVCPTFSNPTGATWNEEQRTSLLRVCDKMGTLVVEDDPYGHIYFEEAGRVVSLGALAERTGLCPGGVVSLGTFSKTVAPGLRTGWAVGDPRLIKALAQAKQAADLHSSSLDQRTLHQLLQDFDLDGHLDIIRREYGTRMGLLAAALHKYGQGQFQFQQPLGGMFLWVEMGQGVDSTRLLALAVEEGVAFVPGAVFYSEPGVVSSARLNFTHSTPEELDLGVRRIMTALEKAAAA